MDEDQFLAGFEEDVTYAIEGDTLFITAPTEDGEEETLQYQRVDVDTAVAGTTWGGLKADWRQ